MEDTRAVAALRNLVDRGLIKDTGGDHYAEVLEALEDKDISALDRLRTSLADYLSGYVETEQERGNQLDEFTFREALDAFIGGAR